MNSEPRVVLHYWGNAFRFVELQPASGHWRNRFALSSRNALDRLCCGFAVTRHFRLIAAYSCPDGRFLHLGGHRYSFASESLQIQCITNDAGTKYRFTAKWGDTVLMDHSYKAVRLKLLNRLDPTYDALDEESDDFYLWLARMASDPQRRNLPFPNAHASTRP